MRHDPDTQDIGETAEQLAARGLFTVTRAAARLGCTVGAFLIACRTVGRWGWLTRDRTRVWDGADLGQIAPHVRAEA